MQAAGNAQCVGKTSTEFCAVSPRASFTGARQASVGGVEALRWSDVSKARHRYGESSDRSDPRQPVYCSDLGSDLFFGVFLSSRAISSLAEGGAFTLPPRMMSLALSFCL